MRLVHTYEVSSVENADDFYQNIKYIDKIYHVQIKYDLANEEIEILQNGVEIDGQKTRPCRINRIKSENNKTWLEFILNEGRNRQIRKMLDTVGKKVLKLDRVKYGPITYDQLKPGEYRELTEKEISSLINMAKKNT